MHQVVQALLSGHFGEDDRVEFKAAWPSPKQKTARKIAGHANLCGGQPILWLIGVDESRRRIVETSAVELSDWWAQTKKHFAGEAPSMHHILMTISGRHVAVLEFATDRAPYVVNTGCGAVQREVPWREGNSTRTAHRHELLRTILDEVGIPELDPILGRVNLTENLRETEDSSRDEVECRAEIFLSAATEAMLPEHRQQMSLNLRGGESIEFTTLQMHGPRRQSAHTAAGGSGPNRPGPIEVWGQSTLAVHGSGLLSITAIGPVPSDLIASLRHARRPELALRLPVDRTGRACSMTLPLRYVPKSSESRAHDIHGFERRLARFDAGAVPSHY